MDTHFSKWRQRLGYGSADLACNLIWQMIALYLMFFYTDVMGLTPAQVATLFLVTRFIDAITDVLMGLLIDRTSTRWGKSRPYFLYGAVPYGLLALLAFYVPDVSMTGKIIYAYITYVGLSAVYTLVNIPMASILPALTGDAQERTVLATTRIIFSFIGATTVGLLTLPMVGFFGGGENQSKGFFFTMLIFAIVGAILFVVTFFNVRETQHTENPKVSAKEAFKALKGNTPWFIFAVNIIFMWGSFFFQMGAMIYYFNYYVGDAKLGSLVAGIASFSPILGTFITPFFAKFYLKRTVFMWASAFNLAGLIFTFFAGTSTALIIIGVVITWVAHGLRHGIYFSMQADPVDYGEWKSGVSAAGILSSINGFIGKVAMALSGAISGWLLTWGGYVANEAQSDNALFAIKLNYLIIPIVMVSISMLIMSFYRLDKQYPQIRAELDARNAG